MVQEAMRRHVLRVLRIWRSWFLFSDDYLNGLQARAAPPGWSTSTQHSWRLAGLGRQGHLAGMGHGCMPVSRYG